MNHTIKVISDFIFIMITKSLKELCTMTGIPETDMRRILKRGVSIGTLKEVSPDKFEMTESGMFVTRKILDKGNQREAGNWKCTKCQTIKNMLNGNKSLKCE